MVHEYQGCTGNLLDSSRVGKGTARSRGYHRLGSMRPKAPTLHKTRQPDEAVETRPANRLRLADEKSETERRE